MIINLKRIHPTLPLPSRGTEHAAGLDVRAAHNGLIPPGDILLVKSGFAAEIPPGHVGLVCPRSGLALKRGVTVLNSPGVIDADYRGEFCALLINHGDRHFEVVEGDRVAQLVIVPVAMLEPREVDELSDTARGVGGFGHTGVV